MFYWYILLGAAITAISYFLWFSPILMVVGVIMVITSISYVITTYKLKIENPGCAIAFVITIIIVITNLFMGGKFVISSYGGLRHLYNDCKYQETLNSHEIGRLSALIWGCYEDCNACKNRNNIEKKIKREQRKAKQKQYDLNFIDKQIVELNSVRQAIIEGDNVDVSEYEFKYEVEDEIRESVQEEIDEGIFEPRRP